MKLINPYHSYPKFLFLFEDLKSLSTVSLETQYGNEVKPMKISSFDLIIKYNLLKIFYKFKFTLNETSGWHQVSPS